MALAHALANVVIGSVNEERDPTVVIGPRYVLVERVELRRRRWRPPG